MRRVISALAVRTKIIASSAWRVLFLALLLLSTPTTADTVQYVYDELGRLIAVIGPGSETTRYTYDEVGNILSVSRQSSSQVSIVSFTPGRGQVGDSVTIYGTGFSATGGQNAVTFNGTPATVSSSTTTTIVAMVPVAATSGLISVTAPNGSATSARAFAVFAPQAPQITSFTPSVVAQGGVVTITGSGFEPVPSDNQVKINTSPSAVITATETNLTDRVPPASGGKISLTTPYGSAATTDDLFIVPPPNTASDVGATARISVDAAGAALTLPDTKIGLLLFDGNAGTSDVRLSVSGVTLPAGGALTVYRPDGVPLLGPYGFGTAGTSFSLASRTSWVRTSAISATCVGDLNRLNAPPIAGPGPDPIAMAAAYCAPASAGGCLSDANAGTFIEDFPTDRTRIFLCKRSDGTTTAGIRYTAQACPAGTVWSGNGAVPGICACPPGDTADGVCALPATGSYGARLTSLGAGGSATVRASRDITGTLTPNNSVNLIFSEPGQVARFAFPGAVRDEVGFDFSNVTLPAGGTLVVTKPDGNVWGTALSFPTGGGAGIALSPLDQTGIHTATVAPAASAIGNVRMTFWTAVGGTLGIDQLNTVSIAYRKQPVRMTFAGLQGQRLGLDISNVTLPSGGTLSVFKPSRQTFLAPVPFASPAGSAVRLAQLVENGNYSVWIDPVGDETGNFNLRLWKDVEDTLTIGVPYNATINYRKQNARLKLNATAGDRLQLELSNVTLPSGGQVIVDVEWAEGQGLAALDTSFGTAGLTANVDLRFEGPYVVKIVPADSGTGTVTVKLSNR